MQIDCLSPNAIDNLCLHVFASVCACILRVCAYHYVLLTIYFQQCRVSPLYKYSDLFLHFEILGAFDKGGQIHEVLVLCKAQEKWGSCWWVGQFLQSIHKKFLTFSHYNAHSQHHEHLQVRCTRCDGGRGYRPEEGCWSFPAPHCT